ncbi:hypothetical protein ScPMuIL_010955 [Solemya velum]
MVRSISTISQLSKVDFSKKYEEAVKTLNTLQSNAQTLERIRKERDKRSSFIIPNMISFIERAGMSMDDIDKLSIIHVCGTKGKGSTCAFSECILRQQGYKTGFFSSPHLVEVRERFKINGMSISKESFSSYFWEVYSRLDETKDSHNGTMPAYFGFLTVMAFHIFMKENVDVAIMEVGIGGQYDSTNVIRKPVVCGVTSLGLDHTSILGTSIEKIAWNKAGIFKPNSVAVTVDQKMEAMKVLQERAQENEIPLYVVPPLQDYSSFGDLQLGIRGTKQTLNASLALQMCKLWMDKKEQENGSIISHGTASSGLSSDLPVLAAFSLTSQMQKGLTVCHWPGRNQCIKRTGITYYLDGAHTVESIEQCVEWFKEASAEERSSILGKVVKILVFNSTGDRDPATLITPLVDCDFSAAVFCPNIICDTFNTADMTNFTVSRERQDQKCLENKEIWERVSRLKLNHSKNGLDFDREIGLQPNQKRRKHQHIYNESEVEIINISHADQSRLELSVKEVMPSAVEDLKDNIGQLQNEIVIWTESFPSISKALSWATQGRDPSLIENLKIPCVPNNLKEADHIQILITGSLHLIGGVMNVINEEVL